MTSPPVLRLVLPHQLFKEHLDVDPDTVFVLIEHDLLFRQYSFHAQKLVLHRASMDQFARRLRARGHQVWVLRSQTDRSSHAQLVELIQKLAPARVTVYDVVDDWLEQDLRAALDEGGCWLREQDVLETPNFLTSRAQVDDWFGSHGARMHEFYVWQRRRFKLLLDADGEPAGGKWSFDAENRKKLPRGYTPPTVGRFASHPILQRDGMFDLDALRRDDDSGKSSESTDRTVSAETVQGSGTSADDDGAADDVQRAIAWVRDEFPDAPGDPALFAWPVSAEEAREHLREFVRERLNDFGPYEDAISAEHPFIAHGLLTPALNIGLLDPREVVQTVLEAADESTPLASVEGFIRQVIGWREYMRATYRTRGRQLRSANRLEHHNTLGTGWWDASTGLAPVDLVISRVLATGYAHHIERLMVLGNAMSLLRIHPDAVYEWFMELFIDAYDWVMVPNVYAMSQFAAGEAITTKPYVSGSNYLRKMSDLPKGDWAQEWDGLYWTFIRDHREIFAANPRARMVVSLLDKMDQEKRRAHHERAQHLLEPGQPSRLLQQPG
ncbi:cryptochrome/photolyase family protein [Nesterenkonia sp. YGD6]|uniref:cryptochrome/photolyase family protein n=1 Tax=Nesterenkonia sp. YGD6 TaxID=2901231 RepID=UPI001F4C56B7|nr:cryptochrome/photolyase family protein [Nesterenkonia sp. YGD6]MCH8563891.1 cryptochrome/photolyase family protein [Nesterenkonia sp. YGD6]